MCGWLQVVSYNDCSLVRRHELESGEKCDVFSLGRSGVEST